MRATWVSASVGILALGACGQAAGERATTSSNMELAAAPAVAPAEGPATRGANATAPVPVGQSAAQPASPSLPQLAFSYSTTIEAPNGRVAGLMRRHEQACAQAGPTQCQVIGSNSSTDRETDAVRAELTLRARPEWLTRFRAGLDGDARGAGGRVLGSQATSEDLTRSIVDAEAYLRAKTTLRDRMQQLLETRNAPLAELLALEQQLAQVQGEIDAATSNLQVMRTRVATSSLTLTYQSTTSAVGGGTWQPVGDAADNFFRVTAWAVAAVMMLAAAALPFVLVVVPAVWFGLRARRRAQARRAGAAAPRPRP